MQGDDQSRKEVGRRDMDGSSNDRSKEVQSNPGFGSRQFERRNRIHVVQHSW